MGRKVRKTAVNFTPNSPFLYIVAVLVILFVLFLCVPGLAGSVGVLVPVGVLIALGAGRIMYKKGWL